MTLNRKQNTKLNYKKYKKNIKSIFSFRCRP